MLVYMDVHLYAKTTPSLELGVSMGVLEAIPRGHRRVPVLPFITYLLCSGGHCYPQQWFLRKRIPH